MTGDVRKRFWRPLGAIAVALGVAVLVYAVFAGIADRDEPLIFMFVVMVGGPAIIPSALGYFMWKGHDWAAWWLRGSIVITLLLGVFLDLFAGLDVFSFAPLSIPLILGCLVWLALSFV